MGMHYRWKEFDGCNHGILPPHKLAYDSFATMVLNYSIGPTDRKPWHFVAFYRVSHALVGWGWVGGGSKTFKDQLHVQMLSAGTCTGDIRDIM